MHCIIRLLPDRFVKLFARPYVAGDSLAEGLGVARRLLEERSVVTTLDLLAEEVREEAQVVEIRAVYDRILDGCAAFSDASTRPTISLKPSSFTTRPLGGGDGGRAQGSEEAIRAILGRADDLGVSATIDMEDRHWTDWTLDLARRLWGEGRRNFGVVLQTRLDRTQADLERLPDGMRVRLVIGIYNEPRSVATTHKREMKRRMLAFARRLFERGHYVEFATHDLACLRRFVEVVVPECKASPADYEVQMLYGVPRRREQDRLVERGTRVRLYVPFATSWAQALAYCRRRLVEVPSMATAVGRNLLRVLGGGG